MTEDRFKDIRPYNDQEVREAAERILADREIMTVLTKFLSHYMPPWINAFISAFINRIIKHQLKKVKCIKDFQRIILKINRIILKYSCRSVTQTGFEKILPEKNYLFISNHRDIVMDAAVITRFYYGERDETMEIAFGDNLLVNQLVSDLLRSNRGFIVKRNRPLREQLEASITLSAYICETIQNGHSVWLAQREGRAKDGNDFTNPALIKMLFLSQRKNPQPYSEFINSLHIVPVAVSYEYDPCDVMKAVELFQRRTSGEYSKAKDEDLKSMIKGIKDPKGRVHVSYGAVLEGNYQNEKEVVKAIDDAIHSGYRLWPTNYIAHDYFTGETRWHSYYTETEKKEFLKRFKDLEPELVKIACEIYANPLINFMNNSDRKN
jgi:1-acyl-sn-glycerol-3-phosphate acyltransferase